MLRRGVGGFEPTPDAFERVIARRDRKQRNQRVAAGVLGIVVFALAAIGLVRLLGSEHMPASDPREPFLGVWVPASDADGGTQTMTVEASGEDAVEIVVTDDVATVCGGTPSTMMGTGRIEGGMQLVIPSPEYTCDDGSEPEFSSGPPLDEQLRDWTLVLDPQTDTLSDGLGGLWVREGAEVPGPEPTLSGGMWPQTSLEEVREAQKRADAGDLDYTWQVDPNLAAWPDSNTKEPWGAEIFERFIREELGWEEFSGLAIEGYVPEGNHTHHLEGVVFLRCAPGRTNPLYPKPCPEMPPEVRGCAPTIDDSRYETVRFTVQQEARIGPSGVWVVTGWEMLQPVEPGSFYEHLYPDFTQQQLEQLAPPSTAEVTQLLEAFLGARVDGEGAERFVHLHEEEEPPMPEEQVPLLYATSGGVPNVRSEIERVQGPVWPTGWIEFKVRLFAQDGTVVEQSFVVVRQEDVRLGLMYGSQTADLSSTENERPVPVPYTLLDGEVTFAAAPPWGLEHVWDPTTTTLTSGTCKGTGWCSDNFVVVADPQMGCEAAPAPTDADADALARSIRSNPDLEATAPVTVSVGGSTPCGWTWWPPRERASATCPSCWPSTSGCCEPIGCACICSTSREGRLGSWPSR